MGRTRISRKTTIPGKATTRSRPPMDGGLQAPGSRRRGSPARERRSPPIADASLLAVVRGVCGRLLLAILPMAAACGLGAGDSGDWAPEEREAVDSLISGLGHLETGITALNEGGGTPRPTGAVQDRALEHLRRAERATAGISDSVLAKIHPELPARYRARLRRGIQDRIRSLEGGHLYRYSSAVTRLGEWADWYNRTRDDWNLPRR